MLQRPVLQRPAALLLTTLDERIRLPLTTWLRVSERVGAVHRLTLSIPEWETLSKGFEPGLVLDRRVRESVELYAPKLVAVLGHERGDASDERRAVVQIVKTIRSFAIHSEIVGFFMCASWATGRLEPRTYTPDDSGAKRVKYSKREPALLGA
jgi:hypothetical protein